MKFICACYSKTGTKTLALALRQLGFTCDDLAEHMDKYQYWNRIYVSDPNDPIAQTPEIFKEMYADVDACTDTPSYLFWEQILEAFPDAKVILIERDEDKWADSLQKHFEKERKDNKGGWFYLYFPRQLMQLLSHQVWLGQAQLRDLMWGQVVGHLSPYGPNRCNMMMARKRYREHNAYVKLKCPKEKLLVYNFKDGYEPLAKFCGVTENIPTGPLPRENVGGTIIDDILERHPRVVQDKQQFMRNLLIFMASFVVIVYFVVRACYLVYFKHLFG